MGIPVSYLVGQEMSTNPRPNLYNIHYMKILTELYRIILIHILSISKKKMQKNCQNDSC